MSRILNKLDSIRTERIDRHAGLPLDAKRPRGAWCRSVLRSLPVGFTLLFAATFSITYHLMKRFIANRHARQMARMAPAPVDVATENARALQHLREGKSAQALMEFVQLTGAAPYEERVLVNLALAYKKKGDKTKAREWLDRALEKNPRDSFAHNNLAILELESDHPAEAVKHLTEALELAPESAEIRLNLARAQENLENFDAAVKHYAEFLERAPATAPAVRAAVFERIRRLSSLAFLQMSHAQPLRSPASQDSP